MTENKADPLREALSDIESWRFDTLGPRPKDTDPIACATEITEAFDRGARMAFHRCAERAKAALAAPQPAAPLGGREVHPIETPWRDHGLPEWFLGNGGTNTKLYALYDAILAIPQESAAECDPQRIREVLGAFYKTVDVMKSARNSNNKLMDVWSDDMKAVEDVMLFLEHLRDATPPVVAGTDRAAIIEECANASEKIAKAFCTAYGADTSLSSAVNLATFAIRAIAGKETGR